MPSVSDKAGKCQLLGERKVFTAERVILEPGCTSISATSASASARRGGRRVGIKQQLEYSARGKQFLIYHRADIQVLGLRYKLDILHIGDSLFTPNSFAVRHVKILVSLAQ